MCDYVLKEATMIKAMVWTDSADAWIRTNLNVFEKNIPNLKSRKNNYNKNVIFS